MKIGNSEVHGFSQLIFIICSSIRSILAFPFICLFGILGVPNFRITYKSGNREYWFFKNLKIKRSGGKLTSLEWEQMATRCHPMHVDIDSIESIVQLW